MAESTNKPVTNVAKAYPVKGHGPKAVDQRLGSARIVMGGSGLVATVLGYPGFEATRLQRGIYDLRFPQSQQTEFYTQVHRPSGGTAGMSGYVYHAEVGGAYGNPTNYAHGEHTSGVAQLFLDAKPWGASTLSVGEEPEEGAVVSLLILQSPSNAY
jgi:hypothetical protein